jgi:hypothetical protein
MGCNRTKIGEDPNRPTVALEAKLYRLSGIVWDGDGIDLDIANGEYAIAGNLGNRKAVL